MPETKFLTLKIDPKVLLTLFIDKKLHPINYCNKQVYFIISQQFYTHLEKITKDLNKIRAIFNAPDFHKIEFIFFFSNLLSCFVITPNIMESTKKLNFTN